MAETGTAAPAKKYEYPFPMPSVTVDLVVFTIRDGLLYFLTIERKNNPHKSCKALPGGFLEVEGNETLDEAAKREAFEETGLKDLFVEQLYTFGDPFRDPRGRIVTVAYYCLVPSTAEPKAGDDAAKTFWIPAAQACVTKMAFDHNLIVHMAIERLKGKIAYSPIARNFLPENFTLPELQEVYETILGKKLDNRNFRKYVKEREIVFPTTKTKGKTRPAKLFTFSKEISKSQLV